MIPESSAAANSFDYSYSLAELNKHKIHIGDLRRSYYVHVPLTGDKQTLMPVVIMLHGAGGSSLNAAMHYGWPEKADKEGFLAVFPEAMRLQPGQPAHFQSNPCVWNDGSELGILSQSGIDDIGFLKGLIEDIQGKYAIDMRRIFLTGFSNGAGLCFRAGVELSEYIAAIAPVMGRNWSADAHPKKPMSALLIVGELDPMNPLLGGTGKNPWGVGEHNLPPMIKSVEPWLKIIGTRLDQCTNAKRESSLCIQYGPGTTGHTLTYIIVEGQGHEWPGQPRLLPESITGPNRENVLNATNFIWDFFQQTSLSQHVHPYKHT